MKQLLSNNLFIIMITFFIKLCNDQLILIINHYLDSRQLQENSETSEIEILLMGTNSLETSIPLFFLKPKVTVDITLAAP